MVEEKEISIKLSFYRALKSRKGEEWGRQKLHLSQIDLIAVFSTLLRSLSLAL